jgi:hypothetical protein
MHGRTTIKTHVNVYAVIVIHVTDTYNLIPIVLTTPIFLLGVGVKFKVPVHVLKTYRERGGMALLFINLGTV